MKMIDSLGDRLRKASTVDILSPPATSAGSSLRRWQWHYRAMIKLRERLLKERAELAAAILDPVESFSLDMADAATDQFDHDVALSLIAAEQDTLFAIEAALGRIRAGTYGLCELTAKPIPAARLRAIPWTRFCQEIEEQLEERGVCRPPHLGELKSVHARVSLDRHGEIANQTEKEGDL
jgi:RNA polymerase-binding transcription factor DksA